MGRPGRKLHLTPKPLLENKVYTQSNIAELILENSYELFLQHKYCDLILRGLDHVQVRVHQLVVAAACGNFYKTVCVPANLYGPKQYDVPNLNGNGLHSLMIYIYSGSITLTKEVAEELLQVHDTFGLTELRAALIDYFSENMTISNCYTMYFYASAIWCHELEDRAFNFIGENFEYLNECRELENFTKMQWEKILSHDAINNCSELTLFNTLKDWMGNNRNRRAQSLELLKLIRFQFLYTYMLVHLLQNTPPRCHQHIIKWIKWHETPAFRSTLDKGFFPKRTLDEKLVLLGNNESIYNLKVLEFNLNRSQWDLCYWPSLPQPRKDFAGIVTRNAVIIAGGEVKGKDSRSVIMMSLEDFEWKELPPMLFHRKLFQLVELKGYLYAIGGCDQDNNPTDSMERFDFENNEWEQRECILFPAVKPPTLFAFTSEDKIYLTGNNVDRIDSYLPMAKKWTARALPKVAGGASYIGFRSDLYSIGGVSRHGIPGVIQRYSMERNLWEPISSLIHIRENTKCFVVADRIIICGGVQNDQVVHYVEEFIPDRNKVNYICDLPKDYNKLYFVNRRGSCTYLRS